jgi:hypothetical protein
LAAGLVLIGLHLWLHRLSVPFEYGLHDPEDPRRRGLVVLVELFAGGILLSLVRTIRNASSTGAFLFWVFLVGIILRGTMFGTHPIQEDDQYRYLWDGAVLAHGMNPYRWSPEDVIQGEGERIPDRLGVLAGESGNVIHRINHPWLRTIYPPVAQAAFALAHIIRPWSLEGWRGFLLAVDLLVFVLLLFILRSFGLSPLWSVLYWWSPLLIKEIFNSGHMDVLVLPFVLGAIFLAIRERYVPASLCLALGVGVKMWPVVLLPVVLRPVLSRPRRLVPALLLFAAVVSVLFLPVYLGGLDEESGFRAYGREWEMNDALYMVFLWGTEHAVDGLSLDGVHKQVAARGVVMVLLAAWIAWCIRRPPKRPIEFFERSLLVVAALFLLSPTQFPWYFVWVLPFVAIRPTWSMLLLAVLLPVYYLRFYFDDLTAVPGLPGGFGWLESLLHWTDISRPVDVFDYRIVWLIYIPVWILIACEWVRSLRGKVPWLSETPAP